jgi:hypothetical protein
MGFFEREVRFSQQLGADPPVRTPRWWVSARLKGRSWLHLAGLTSVAESQQVAIDTWAAFLRRLSVPVSAEKVGELLKTRHAAVA